MRNFISIFIFFTIKTLTHLFYRSQIGWIGDKGKDPWSEDIKVIAFLNHTSLYEPLFLTALPYSFLWKLANRMVAPAASKTLDRPFVGTFFKLMAPKMTSITRKRDDTWTEFMDSIDDDCIIIILPEGRMMRKNGLDVDGNKMTIRGGISDVLNKLDSGKMIMAYSGGLHHIQIPGQTIPRLFRKLRINVELLDIPEYKSRFESKIDLIADLQHKLETNVPPYK
jgi:hypothetical protein